MQCYVPPVAILDTEADVFQFLATHGVLDSEFLLALDDNFFQPHNHVDC
jgi:hypothetical protein